MKVLIYGGGAREHALAWKIKQSPSLDAVCLCGANDGFKELGEGLEAANFAELASLAKDKGIDLLVVGPEIPLVDGIVDEFKKIGIPAIGADSKWAKLEGSKSFAKEFMARNDIPTGRYEVISDTKEVYNVLDKFNMPVVLKADGLAAGKGVYISRTRVDAEVTLQEYLEGKFGEASKKVVVEEFLEGREISLISLWDGKTLLPFIPARDYKKLEDGDKGLNTGGMGAYCPVSLSLEEFQAVEDYTKKLETAFRKEEADFTGVVYSGLIFTEEGLCLNENGFQTEDNLNCLNQVKSLKTESQIHSQPAIKVLEYNMRFGDPETQPLLMHLDSDLLEIFKKCIEQKLDEVSLKWKEEQTFCVVVAAEGYPENPKKGGEIKNIDEVINNHGVTVFFAGVEKQDGKLLASGGRVLSICQTGVLAQKYIYDALQELDYSDKIFRKDIGEVSLSKEVCQKDSCGGCG